MRRPRAPSSWPRGGGARQGRRARCARPFGRIAARPRALPFEQSMTRQSAERRNRLAEVVLDEATIPPGWTDLDHEREVAIFDLIEENSFAVPGRDDGPYALK